MLALSLFPLHYEVMVKLERAARVLANEYLQAFLHWHTDSLTLIHHLVLYKREITHKVVVWKISENANCVSFDLSDGECTKYSSTTV